MRDHFVSVDSMSQLDVLKEASGQYPIVFAVAKTGILGQKIVFS